MPLKVSTTQELVLASHAALRFVAQKAGAIFQNVGGVLTLYQLLPAEKRLRPRLFENGDWMMPFNRWIGGRANLDEKALCESYNHRVMGIAVECFQKTGQTGDLGWPLFYPGVFVGQARIAELNPYPTTLAFAFYSRRSKECDQAVTLSIAMSMSAWVIPEKDIRAYLKRTRGNQMAQQLVDAHYHTLAMLGRRPV